MQCARIAATIILFTACATSAAKSACQTPPQQLVFMSLANNNAHQVSLVRTDGSGLVNLKASDNAPAAWSHSGRYIAFSDDGLIYRMNADGSGLIQLSPSWASTASSADSSPDWSLDDSKLIFTYNFVVDNRIAGNITMMSATDGSGRTTILGNGQNMYTEAHFSLNGASLVIASDVNQTYGNFQIFEMPVVNGVPQPSGTTQITHVFGVAFDPWWAPDSRTIVLKYVLANVGNVNVGLMNADGSNLHPLTDLVEPLEAGEPSFSPDGSKIAYEVDDCTGLGPACYGQSDDRAPAAIWTMNADGSGQASIGQACAAEACTPRYQ
jgi:Tol biopolymer transport system component